MLVVDPTLLVVVMDTARVFETEPGAAQHVESMVVATAIRTNLPAPVEKVHQSHQMD